MVCCVAGGGIGKLLFVLLLEEEELVLVSGLRLFLHHLVLCRYLHCPSEVARVVYSYVQIVVVLLVCCCCVELLS